MAGVGSRCEPEGAGVRVYDEPGHSHAAGRIVPSACRRITGARGGGLDLAAAGRRGPGRRGRRPPRGPVHAAGGRRARAAGHRQERRGAGPDTPQHGAPDGRRRHGAVPRHAVRHRTGHRRGLLLRLRRQPAVRARRPRGHRGQDARAGRGRPAVRTAALAARRGARLLCPARRAAQGPVDRGEDGGPVARLGLHDQGPRDLRRFLRRPARARRRASSRRSSCSRRPTPTGRATRATRRCSGSTARRFCTRKTSRRT